jgi:hypothetical protein
MSIEEPPAAARARGPATASDLSGEAPETGFIDRDLPDMLDDEPTEAGPNDAELESLAHNKFAPRPAASARATTLDSAPSSQPPTPPAAAPAAELPRSVSERSPTPALQAGSWTPPPMRPLAAARMPDATPWPTAIRPTDRGFATAPLSASSVAASQPRLPPDPSPTAAARSRSGVWGAALGVVIIVAGVALAYTFRNEIAALIDPIASNLFHRATPPAS